jgi:hypothetical protein
MKDKLLNFFAKHFTGFHSVKIKKDLYLNFPKLAPIFTLAFLLYFLGEKFSIKPLNYAGYVLVALSIFGFFFNNIFKNKK